MKFIAKRICVLFLFCLTFVQLNGQQIITDRPDQTESSSTIEKNSLQIESGLLLGFTGDQNEIERQFIGPSTLFRIGITKGIELRVLSQYENIKLQNVDKSFSGISDLEIGTKIQLFQKEDVNTEIAFLSHLIMPTGTTSLTNDDFGTINKLSISHEINDEIGVGYNLGYDYFGSNKGNLTYSLAIGIGITDKLSVYIEPYGALTEFEDHESNIDAGLTYLTRENFQLDFSFGTGINYNMNYLSLGFSWHIKRKK